jgi:hypothetical protein
VPKAGTSPVHRQGFKEIAKAEIETGFSLRVRHDLEGKNGKAQRGWSGLAVVLERTVPETLENQSA